MHCANLDALVKDMRSVQLTSPAATLPAVQESIAELPPDDDTQILRMVLDIGIFVLEGRLPHRKSKRGYIEGPHCVQQPPRNPTHRCDYANYVCERAEKYRRLMEAIWNENKTLCIELRICADCSCGAEQVWKNSISRHDYVLEQWIFEITNFRNKEGGIGVMNGYGLLQAIRSQIHFSQLSAWWSSNQAQLPKNITYHVIPLTQIDLDSCSVQHTFPVLSFSSTYLQVKVRSQPRSEVLPKIHCPIHCSQNDVVDDRMKIYCDRLGKHHCQAAVDDFEDSFRYGFMVPEAIDGVIDEDAVRKVRTMKYSCSTSTGTPKHAQNECTVSDKRFSTFHKNPKDLTSQYPRRVSHSSSFLESSSSSVDPLEHYRVKIESPSCSDIIRQKTTPFTASNRAKISEMEIIRRSLHRTRTSTSPLNLPSNKRTEKNLIAFEKTAKVERMAFLPRRSAEDVSEEVWEEDIYLQADRNVIRSDSPQAKVGTAFGAGDKCCGVGFLHASFRKDRNNNRKMVEIRGNGGEGAKKSSRLSTKNGLEHKLTDKMRTTVIKKYFKMKKGANKPLLPLFGNVIESVLSGRMYFSRVVENFKIKITSCVPSGGYSGGSELPAAAYYYHFGDVDLSRSYLVKSCIPDREKGIQILSNGQLQVSVFNTENSLIKVFIVPYDLSDMPRCTKTYIRHSNYYAPSDITKYSIKWLQSLIQFKCFCSKSGRLYLQSEVNVIIFQKSDLNTACELQQGTELKHHNVTEMAYK